MLQRHAAAQGRTLGLCQCPRPAAAAVGSKARRTTQAQPSMLSPTARQHGWTGCTQINSTPLDSSSGNTNSDQHPTSSSSSSSSSTAPQSVPAPTDFVPERLTKGLRNATSISALEYLWRKYQPQFNSYHFSALMQQLTRLHEQVTAGITQTGSAQHPGQQQQAQQQQQQQDRNASLAELEQELGHLLDSSSGSSSSSAGPTNSRSTPTAAGANAAAAAGRRRRSNSRGLAGLVPAIDGYEHLTNAPAAKQQQQRQRVAWRNSQQPSQPSAAAGATAAAAGRTVLQPGPAWQPAAGAAGGSSDSSSRRPQQRQQRPLLPASMQLHRGQQQQQQQQQARAELHSIHALALTAAAAALHPERRRVLDRRALVMVAHNLAKMQLQDSSIMQQLLQALGPDVLQELDPQQLTNLIWAVGVSGSNAQGDSSSPYRLLLVPAALRRSGTVVPVIAAAAALVDSSSGSSQGLGGVPLAWEQVPAVAEPAAADKSCDELPTAAVFDAFADAMAVSPPVSSTAPGSSSTCHPSGEWLAAAAEALLQQLSKCSSQGVSMALWGFAQLGFSPRNSWWEGFWPGTQDSLQKYSPQDLALLMCAVGKLGPQVPADWLSAYCSAACDVMPAMSSQQLTMCLWGLACAGATPHKAFVLLWFLSSIGLMAQATTQELSMWLYALALLRITPSPSWCSAFVEASFGAFTAPHTRPQDLVTAMWSISRLGWSPPLLYWRGLMEAASKSFSRFGPQDLANCVSAASAVDIGCISDAWLSAFAKASQARLSAFEPVQLAHTANALAVISKPHPSAYRIIDTAWQAAFVNAARHHLAAGRFSLRNLALVVTSLRVLRFKQAGEVQEFLADAEAALAGMWAQEQQRLVLNELQAE